MRAQLRSAGIEPEDRAVETASTQTKPAGRRLKNARLIFLYFLPSASGGHRLCRRGFNRRLTYYNHNTKTPRPHIFDNIELSLLPALRETIKLSYRAYFCVGYFNLRGWRKISESIQAYTGKQGACCRLLVGMQRLPSDELNANLSLRSHHSGIDNSEINRIKKRMAEEFRQQLTIGAPNDEDEKGLQQLSYQIKTQKSYC